MPREPWHDVKIAHRLEAQGPDEKGYYLLTYDCEYCSGEKYIYLTTDEADVLIDALRFKRETVESRALASLRELHAILLNGMQDDYDEMTAALGRARDVLKDGGVRV